MPAYDYRCTSCHTIFEVTRKAGSPAEESCPQCSGTTKRVFTPVGVVFKGSGFYNTDRKPRPKEGSTPTATPAPAPCKADKESSSACSSCPAAASE
ncbi:MAG: zinc ribbon domain-containing protein [Coriobacteriia bacterium]|nr:zinc ribbon domain-containing protein [Coriobacteriia bacterium]